MGEFDLIARYFTRPVRHAALGVGDDCALLQPAPGMQLAISSDMLVEGRHFFADVDPQALGHKALAVNLSDLAACGARPLAFTLALSLPRVDAPWLQAFADGLWALAETHGCELIGGDTTAGPLNLCITVFGEVPAGQALLRRHAQPGDTLWVSGQLGDARLALEALQGKITLAPPLLAQARERLERPTPRVALGQALRGVAHAMMDLSDGLCGDLGHLLKASQVGATLEEAALLALPAARHHAEAPQDAALWRRCVLSGGDDYELLFTAPADAREAVLRAGALSGTPVHPIGRIEATPGLRLHTATGVQDVTERSFDHFA